MSKLFDKRLAELDAYLQMLIVENESLDRKIEDISSSNHSSNCETELDGLTRIKSNLETLLGSIKHSIVLLQIAKVSLRSPDSSVGSDSTSSSVATPSRPARSTKSASSTSSLRESLFKISSKNQSAKLDESSNRFVSLEHTSSSQKQQPNQILSSSQKSGENFCSAGTPTKVVARPISDSVMNARRAHNHQSQSYAISAGRERSEYEALNVAFTTKPHAAISAAGQELKSGSASCSYDRNGAYADTIRSKHDVNGEVVVDDEDDDDDAFFDAADEQHVRPSTYPTTAATPSGYMKGINKGTGDKKNINNNQDDFGHHTGNLSLVDDKVESMESQNIKAQQQSPITMPPNNETNNNIKSTSDSDGSVDWDALYEDEDEDDLGSLENQGSVIKHLLSQIRIGMDLSKVVLPTFILERRSLLEMYADFFAHPDLFSAIPDYKTPEERMVHLVRWYLSAFHAGRKSSVAKKPYNPILGEIFKCRWDLGVNNDKTTPIKNVQNSEDNDGDEQKLTFIAEQVSHHPPESAFYAENKKRSISCSAHIYTKSQFLGLSVGVHNIGKGVIRLLNHNETYECTFPSAYGRSILTVPWVELVGPVNIKCNETGYKADIKFIAKPFYGGKKHSILGQILRPNNEPFLTIEGEWNGVMYSSCPPRGSDRQVFVDTRSLPVIKKHVGPVSTQDSFESRNVWKEVTRALRLQDITTATAAKTFIEQRQRDLVKDRLERGIKWTTRYFEACDEGWRYRNPLSLSGSSGSTCESEHQQHQEQVHR